MISIDIECGQTPTNQSTKLTSGNNMYNDKHYLIIDNTMDFHSTIEHKELMYSIYDYIYSNTNVLIHDEGSDSISDRALFYVIFADFRYFLKLVFFTCFSYQNLRPLGSSLILSLTLSLLFIQAKKFFLESLKISGIFKEIVL